MLNDLVDQCHRSPWNMLHFPPAKLIPYYLPVNIYKGALCDSSSLLRMSSKMKNIECSWVILASAPHYIETKMSAINNCKKLANQTIALIPKVNKFPHRVHEMRGCVESSSEKFWTILITHILFIFIRTLQKFHFSKH